MKKFAVIVALLAALTMVFSGCCCMGGVDAPLNEIMNIAQPTVEGLWEAELDMTETLNEMSGVDVGSFTMRITMDFRSDGTMAASIDKDHLEEQTFEMVDYIVNNSLDEIIEGYGLSQDEFEDLLAQDGMSMDEFIEMMKEEVYASYDPEELFGNLDDFDGYYKVENDMLYVADYEDELDSAEAISFTLTRDTLCLEMAQMEELTGQTTLEMHRA